MAKRKVVNSSLKRKVEMYAWVFTDKDHPYPVIYSDFSEDVVKEEKKRIMRGENDEHTKMLKRLYKKTKIVPVEITYENGTN